MNYRERIANLQSKASSRFNNFQPSSTQGYANHQQVQDFSQYNDWGGGYNDVATQPAPASEFDALGFLDRTLTIIVENTTTDDQLATVFGSSYDLTDSLLPAGVTVNCDESSHRELKTSLIGNPMRIRGMKMVVSDQIQFSNKISITLRQPTGVLGTKPYQPLTYRSAQQQITSQIDDMGFDCIIDTATLWQFTVNAGVTVTFILTIGAVNENRNGLRGRPNVKVSPYAAPTGLPQLDMGQGFVTPRQQMPVYGVPNLGTR